MDQTHFRWRDFRQERLPSGGVSPPLAHDVLKSRGNQCVVTAILMEESHNLKGVSPNLTISRFYGFFYPEGRLPEKRVGLD